MTTVTTYEALPATKALSDLATEMVRGRMESLRQMEQVVQLAKKQVCAEWERIHAAFPDTAGMDYRQKRALDDEKGKQWGEKTGIDALMHVCDEFVDLAHLLEEFYD